MSQKRIVTRKNADPNTLAHTHTHTETNTAVCARHCLTYKMAATKGDCAARERFKKRQLPFIKASCKTILYECVCVRECTEVCVCVHIYLWHIVFQNCRPPPPLACLFYGPHPLKTFNMPHIDTCVRVCVAAVVIFFRYSMQHNFETHFHMLHINFSIFSACFPIFAISLTHFLQLFLMHFRR